VKTIGTAKLIGVAVLVSVMASMIISEAQSIPDAKTLGSAAGLSISIDDVDRFYHVYDAANGHPSADELQHDYLDKGSEGLRQFAKLRHISGTTIAGSLAKHPEMYSNARRCADVLPHVRQRAAVALRKLGDLYPEAKFPPVTIAVGHGKPVGVGSPVSGVQIGLEALCAVNWMNPNLEDRFVHLIAHEYAHVQQVRALVDDEHPTVLEASLIEGAAEFTAELTSGEVSSYQFIARPKGDEKEIETAFVSDEDKTDLSKWLYNGTLEKPGDLGYWIGYRIVKSYYTAPPTSARRCEKFYKCPIQNGSLLRADGIQAFPFKGRSWSRNRVTAWRTNPNSRRPCADSPIPTILAAPIIAASG